MTEIITTELTQLATEINAEHIQCLQAMRYGLDHAVKVGELLNQAKEIVDHGDWLPWIADNCKFSERTARAYMRVNRNWPEMSKTATTADLTLSGALKLLDWPNEQQPIEDYQVPHYGKAKKNKTDKLNLKDAKSVIAIFSAIDLKIENLTEAERSAYGDDVLIKIIVKLTKVLEELVKMAAIRDLSIPDLDEAL